MGVAEELDEFTLGGGLGLEFVEQSFAHFAIGGFVLSGEQDGLSGEAVLESVLRRDRFAGFGARAGGVLRCAGINRHEVGNERVLQERR